MRAQEKFAVEMLEQFEICAVQNGWVVRPSSGWQMANDSQGRDHQIHVFHTVDQLCAWLKAMLPVHSATADNGC